MMPSPWVLLQRNVEFIDGGSAGGAGKAAAAIGNSSGEASLEEVAAGLKPNPVVGDPPEVTSLSMLRHLPKFLIRGIDGGKVSSTDKGLVVIYTGMYRPGNGAHPQPGCYLVYDAANNSVSAIPQLDPPSTRTVWSTINIKGLGTSAAILRLRHGADGAYVLAELVTTLYPGLPDAHLYLWSSSSKAASNPYGGPWRRTAACLPLPAELCGPTSFFHIDMAFAFGDSCVCWADLAAGVLICDLFAPRGPKFSFVPLPPECPYTCENTRAALQEFRSMGCVCGAIKFVALVGYSEGLPKAEVVLKTWTLSSDFKDWMGGAAVLVRDLWESKSFRDKELPRGWPMNPVLSMNEDDIIYISLSDIEFVEAYDFYGQYTGRQLVLNGHYVLRLDLLRNEVLYSKKSTTNSLSLLMPFVLASDFSAYLHGRKDSQRGKEVSEVGTTVKRKEASEVGTMMKRKRTKY